MVTVTRHAKFFRMVTHKYIDSRGWHVDSAGTSHRLAVCFRNYREDRRCRTHEKGARQAAGPVFFGRSPKAYIASIGLYLRQGDLRGSQIAVMSEMGSAEVVGTRFAPCPKLGQ